MPGKQPELQIQELLKQDFISPFWLFDEESLNTWATTYTNRYLLPDLLKTAAQSTDTYTKKNSYNNIINAFAHACQTIAYYIDTLADGRFKVQYPGFFTTPATATLIYENAVISLTGKNAVLAEAVIDLHQLQDDLQIIIGVKSASLESYNLLLSRIMETINPTFQACHQFKAQFDKANAIDCDTYYHLNIETTIEQHLIPTIRRANPRFVDQEAFDHHISSLRDKNFPLESSVSLLNELRHNQLTISCVLESIKNQPSISHQAVHDDIDANIHNTLKLYQIEKLKAACMGLTTSDVKEFEQFYKTNKEFYKKLFVIHSMLLAALQARLHVENANVAEEVDVNGFDLPDILVDTTFNLRFKKAVASQSTKCFFQDVIIASMVAMKYIEHCNGNKILFPNDSDKKAVFACAKLSSKLTFENINIHLDHVLPEYVARPVLETIAEYQSFIRYINYNVIFEKLKKVHTTPNKMKLVASTMISKLMTFVDTLCIKLMELDNQSPEIIKHNDRFQNHIILMSSLITNKYQHLFTEKALLEADIVYKDQPSQLHEFYQQCRNLFKAWLSLINNCQTLFPDISPKNNLLKIKFFTNLLSKPEDYFTEFEIEHTNLKLLINHLITAFNEVNSLPEFNLSDFKNHLQLLVNTMDFILNKNNVNTLDNRHRQKTLLILLVQKKLLPEKKFMAFSKQKFDIATQPTTGRITAADLQQAKETIKNVKFSYCMIKVIEEVMVNNKTELADLNITSKNIANHIKNVSLTVNLDLNEMESTGRLSPDLIAGIVDALKSTTKIQNDLLAFIRLDIINYAKPATSSKTKNSVALAQPSRPQARLLPPVPLFAVSAKPVIKKVAPLARQFTFSLAEPVINETDKRKALHDATFLQLQMAYKDLRNDLEALRKKYRQLESSCQADKSASHSIVCLYPDENNQINQLWEEFLFQEKAVVQSRDYTPDNGIALSGLVKSKNQLQQSIDTLFHIIENKLTNFSKAKKGLSHKAREFEKAQKNKIDEKIAQNNIARVRQADADESRSQANLLKMKGKTSLPGALEPSASKTPLLDEKPHNAIPLNQDVVTKQFSTIQIPQLNEVIKSFIQLKKARTNLTIHNTEDAHYYNLLYNIYRSFHGLKVYQQLASVKSSLIKETSLQGLHALQQQFGIASNLPEILKFLDSLTIEIPAAWLSAEFEITASHRELFLEKNLSLNAIRQQRYAINEFSIHIANTKLYQSMVNLHNTHVNHRNPMDDIAALQSYIRVIQTIHASIPVNPILRYTMQQVLMTEHLEKIHAISMLMMFCSQVSRDLIFVDENLREFILKCTQQAHALSDTKVCYQEHVMSCITLLNNCDNYLGEINAESFQYAKPLSTYLEQAIIRCVYLNNKTDYTHWSSIAAVKSYADLYHSYQCYRAIRTYHYIGKYKSFPTVKEVQQDFIALFMQSCNTNAQRKFVDTITKDYQGNFPSEYSHLPYIAQLGLHKKDIEKLLMHFKFFTADTISYFANEQYNPQVSDSPIHHSNFALHKMHRQPPSLDYLQLTRHLLSLMKDILHFIHTYPGADSNKPIEFLDFCLVETQALRMLVLICGELEQYIMVSDIQLHEFFREAKSALKKSFSETSYDSSVTKDLDFIYRLDQQLKSYAPHLIHIKTTLLSPHVSNSFFYNGPIPLRLEEENHHRYIFS